MTTGPRIRTIRLRAGLRLQDVAERCGCTKSLLSKIETGASKPPIATLMGIAKALRVPVATLLDEAAEARTVMTPASRSAEEAMERTDKGYRFALIAGERVDKAMQPFVFKARRGEITPSGLRHAGEEFVQVLEGALRLRVGAIDYRLARGDSLYFDSDEEHDVMPESAEATWLAVFCERPAARLRAAPGKRRSRGPAKGKP